MEMLPISFCGNENNPLLHEHTDLSWIYLRLRWVSGVGAQKVKLIPWDGEVVSILASIMKDVNQ